MKIFAVNTPVEEKTIKWLCPVTGNYILGHFSGNQLMEYCAHSYDGSFYDNFDNFFHASNWMRKHVDKRFKVPYTGIRIAGLNKTAFLDGEWWIIDGKAHFADGEVGDFNHERYVVDYARDLLTDGEEDWESWKGRKAMEMYEEIKANYAEDKLYEMRYNAENEPESFIVVHMDEVGLDSDTFFIANGNSSKDPREWSMQKFGWKRMAGNNITTWTLSSSDLESIKRGIWDAFEPEQLENEVFNIEVMSNKKMFWRVPMDVIESGNMNFYMDRSKEWGVTANSGKFKIYRKAATIIKAYHGSNKPFEKFDREFSTNGVFWFSENLESIKRGESGANSSEYIAEVELTVDKVAGWDEYEKLYLEQINDAGFDSIKLDDDWIIFDNNRIKILKWLKNE